MCVCWGLAARPRSRCTLATHSDPGLASNHAALCSDQEWVDTYSDPGFEELAASLERLLDRYAGRLEDPKSRMEEVRKLYVRAMELELGFFAAWDPQQDKQEEL